MEEITNITEGAFVASETDERIRELGFNSYHKEALDDPGNEHVNMKA
jgi:hypothetical protein